MTEQNNICHFKDAGLEEHQFSSWISKTSTATNTKCKTCMKGIDIANMGKSALKIRATSDRHNCIWKEQERNKSFFTIKSNVNREVENLRKFLIKSPGMLKSGGQ